jgi:hypothetical protein
MAGQLVAASVDAWVLLSNESTLKISTDRENGKVYKSSHYVINMKRTAIRVSQYSEATGGERFSFSFYVGGGSTIGFASVGSPGKKYICTSDKLAPVNLVTGECEQEQTWEHVSPPEEYTP